MFLYPNPSVGLGSRRRTLRKLGNQNGFIGARTTAEGMRHLDATIGLVAVAHPRLAVRCVSVDVLATIWQSNNVHVVEDGFAWALWKTLVESGNACYAGETIDEHILDNRRSGSVRGRPYSSQG